MPAISHTGEGEVTVERATILVADDEHHIQHVLKYLLEQEGYAVVLADDGEQALARVDDAAPDLVLLDIMMPRLDGFAVLRSLRANLETMRLPVILLTAKDAATEKVAGLRDGANDYIIKPFDQEELLLRVRNMLDTARAQREANPLTGLPGNLAIAREAQRRLAGGDPFAVMYIDIDRFKSFNDSYGYARGDQAITCLAHLLCEAVRPHSHAGVFVGHVGGDDFIAMVPSRHGERIACTIVREFDSRVATLHDPEHVRRGYLEVRNRQGTIERVPLITLTIALVVDARGRFEHPAALSDALAELKRFGKAQPGSVVVKERRAPAEAPQVVLVTGGGVHEPGP